MKNYLLFLFHNTLEQRHLDLCLGSLLERQTTKLKWDRVLVYNTHSTITTESIVERFRKHPDVIGDIVVIQPTGVMGSLHQDLRTCFTWIKDNIPIKNAYDSNEQMDRILVLKGDYSLSTNFNEVYLQTHVPFVTQWSLPIYNSKEFVDDWDILEKLEQPYFQLVNNDTYYRCGTNPEHTPVGEVLSLLGRRDEDPSVKFVAHNVLPDYNLHVFTTPAAHLVTECFDAMPVQPGWNCVGEMFKMLMYRHGVYFHTATRAFGVHTFHATDRGDPRKMIPGQRY